MSWTVIWMQLFGTCELLGINIGFWAAMTVCVLVVAAMNAVFWSLKPNTKSNYN
ncbi:MAG: hypothetical protein PHE02_10700 [Lachnospiraceae bacterium]|nr:hypothetical protein [Lachnospiraceae bacterium]